MVATGYSFRKLHIGPLHFSLVHNIPMAELQSKKVSGFVARSGRWFCATVHAMSWYLNLDVDLRIA